MGCWGITAFESDAGLDAVGFIRETMLKDGRMELGEIIKALQKEAWYAPPEASEGVPHTSPMALAEIIVKFLDGNREGMDDNWDDVPERKFGNITSFTASRESLQWLRDYISDSLKYAKENAVKGNNWGGWFEKKNWIGWQNHMEKLVSCLDELLSSGENCMELVPLQRMNEEKNHPVMGDHSLER